MGRLENSVIDVIEAFAEEPDLYLREHYDREEMLDNIRRLFGDWTAQHLEGAPHPADDLPPEPESLSVFGCGTEPPDVR